MQVESQLRVPQLLNRSMWRWASESADMKITAAPIPIIYDNLCLGLPHQTHRTWTSSSNMHRNQYLNLLHRLLPNLSLPSPARNQGQESIIQSIPHKGTYVGARFRLFRPIIQPIFLLEEGENYGRRGRWEEAGLEGAGGERVRAHGAADDARGAVLQLGARAPGPDHHARRHAPGVLHRDVPLHPQGLRQLRPALLRRRRRPRRSPPQRRPPQVLVRDAEREEGVPGDVHLGVARGGREGDAQAGAPRGHEAGARNVRDVHAGAVRAAYRPGSSPLFHAPRQRVLDLTFSRKAASQSSRSTPTPPKTYSSSSPAETPRISLNLVLIRIVANTPPPQTLLL